MPSLHRVPSMHGTTEGPLMITVIVRYSWPLEETVALEVADEEVPL